MTFWDSAKVPPVQPFPRESFYLTMVRVYIALKVASPALLDAMPAELKLDPETKRERAEVAYFRCWIHKAFNSLLGVTADSRTFVPAATAETALEKARDHTDRVRRFLGGLWETKDKYPE